MRKMEQKWTQNKKWINERKIKQKNSEIIITLDKIYNNKLKIK